MKESPILITNLNLIEQKFDLFRKYFSPNNIYYAMKANPNPKVIRKIFDMGSSFDAASYNEIVCLLEHGISSDKICYGNPIKKISDIQMAYGLGVKKFVTDCKEDLENILNHASDAEILLRIQVGYSRSSRWPLDKKFGCSKEQLPRIFNILKSYNKKISGFSFHVGSQQMAPLAWGNALERIGDTLDEYGLYLIDEPIINIGGGFPVNYKNDQIDLDCFLSEIKAELNKFSLRHKDCFFCIEPGRALTAEAGYILSEVILIKEIDNIRWVYLDIGRYGGLAETFEEAILYNIKPLNDKLSDIHTEVIIAGPTCDSTDILYENHKYCLPIDLKQGDYLIIEATGAYTSSYSSVNFNGFNSLRQVVIER